MTEQSDEVFMTDRKGMPVRLRFVPELVLKEEYHRTAAAGETTRHQAIAAEFKRRDPTSRRANPQI